MKFRKLKFKILAAALLLIIILCAAFVRIVPDYSTSRGFAVVSLSDYNKYKQGYCLKEDRILSKEERFKRGILDALERYVLFEAAMADRCYYMYGMEQCNYGNSKFAVKVGFYETDKFNNDDWLEVLSKEYDIEKRKNQAAWPYRNILVEKFQMKPVNIAERLKINLKEGFAGFEIPVIEYAGLNKYLLYLDKSFILYDDFKFRAILVRIPEGYTPKDYWIESNIIKERFKINYIIIIKAVLKSIHVVIVVLKFMKITLKKKQAMRWRNYLRVAEKL